MFQEEWKQPFMKSKNDLTQLFGWNSLSPDHRFPSRIEVLNTQQQAATIPGHNQYLPGGRLSKGQDGIVSGIVSIW